MYAEGAADQGHAAYALMAERTTPRPRARIGERFPHECTRACMRSNPIASNHFRFEAGMPISIKVPSSISWPHCGPAPKRFRLRSHPASNPGRA